MNSVADHGVRRAIEALFLVRAHFEGEHGAFSATIHLSEVPRRGDRFLVRFVGDLLFEPCSGFGGWYEVVKAEWSAARSSGSFVEVHFGHLRNARFKLSAEHPLLLVAV